MLLPLSTFVVILLLNAVILQEILHTSRERKAYLLGIQSNVDISKNDQRAQRLLGACVMIYLVTQFPVSLINIFFVCFKDNISTTELTIMRLMYIRTVLLDLNYSSNFYVYCFASPRFQESLNELGMFKLIIKKKQELKELIQMNELPRPATANLNGSPSSQSIILTEAEIIK